VGTAKHEVLEPYLGDAHNNVRAVLEIVKWVVSTGMKSNRIRQELEETEPKAKQYSVCSGSCSYLYKVAIALTR